MSLSFFLQQRFFFADQTIWLMLLFLNGLPRGRGETEGAHEELLRDLAGLGLGKPGSVSARCKALTWEGSFMTVSKVLGEKLMRRVRKDIEAILAKLENFAEGNIGKSSRSCHML